VAPKFVPVIVTDVATVPDEGESPVILGVGNTVNGTPALATPLTVTTTLPLLAFAGTVAIMEVALQLVIVVATVPLKATELVPCVAPKFVPEIVTAVPTGAEAGASLEIAGVGSTVKEAPLLAFPATVTMTFPVVAVAGTGTRIEVALQLVGTPATPLKVTVLLP